MKRIKFFRLFTVFLLLFLLYNNHLGADEKNSPQISRQIDLWYKQASEFYQHGEYTQAKTILNKIIKTLASDPPTVIWRRSHNTQPGQEAFYTMLRETEEQIGYQKARRKQMEEQQLELKKKLAEEERLAKQVALKKQIKELQAKKEEQARQAAAEKTRLEKERQEAQKKREVELAKLAQEKEAKARQLAEEKAEKEKQKKLEVEAKAKQLAQEKAKREEQARLAQEAKAKQLAQEKAKREEQARLAQEAKAKQLAQEKAKREVAQKAQEEEQVRLKAEREKQAQEKEAQLKLEKERLTQEREARLRQLAEEKARKEEERRLEAEAKRQRDLVLRQTQLQARQEKEAQLKLEKERLAQEREARLRQLAEEKARKEEERRLEAEAKVKERQQELARQEEEMKAKLRASLKSVAQEKAITEAMLKKQSEDKAKIEKIEQLWRRARGLYSQERYEEAIRDFQKIIQLEGNPRIKYTPEAKKYIEEAKNKMIEKEKVVFSKGIDLIERDMINEVIKQQTPPYIEPPLRIEEIEEVTLIEAPLIRKKLKKNITLDFDKVGLESVLTFLSQESEVNFIASQKVLDTGFKVTARFQETPAEEVIKYITKSQGLIYRIDKEIIWIAHPEEIAAEPLETRVYYLNKGGGLFTEFSPVTAGTTETGLGGSSAQITKISTIEDTLKEMVPWPADSKLVYDKRINALIIRNTPHNLQMLEDLLYSIDITPYQILIEARFLEVDITDVKELGVEWKLTSGNLTLKDRDGVFKGGLGTDSGVDFTSFSRASEGLNLTYKGMLTNSQFQAVLHALESTTKLKTLSSPRITTLNNQMASIKVVDEWIYPTRYEYEVVQSDINGDGDFSDAGETTYKNVPKDFLRRDVGILLKVIPSVGADKKTISLSLIPEVSEATADAFSYTGGVTLPKFTSRNLSTTVVANSGDTVVLGGLIKESRTKTTVKVPFFGDIPLLGGLFKKDTDSIQRKNLLIFVTAKVLSPSGEEVVVAQK